MSNPDGEAHRTERATIWAIAIVIVAVVASIAQAIAYTLSTTRTAAIEAGLVQGTLPGKEGVYWVRPSGEGRGAIDAKGANHDGR